MNLPRSIHAPLLLGVLTVVRPIVAQQPATIPIRAVAPPSATSPLVGAVDELREVAGGKVLVNDGGNRQLILLDATLQHPTILADTLGTGSVYPRIGKLIPYAADSTLFYDSDGRSLDLLDPQGKFIRVLALPRPQDF